ALHSVLSPYFQNQLLQQGTGSTALGIKASKLPQLQVFCPPLTEQMAIVDFIERQCFSLSSAIARAHLETDLLREYRTRLIADVVTGTLDIREAAAQLPDETDAADSLDDFESESVDEEAAADSLKEALEDAKA